MLEGNGKPRWCIDRYAVYGLDIDCQDLSSLVRLRITVKTSRVPSEGQVALGKLVILLEICECRVLVRA